MIPAAARRRFTGPRRRNLVGHAWKPRHATQVARAEKVDRHYMRVDDMQVDGHGEVLTMSESLAPIVE